MVEEGERNKMKHSKPVKHCAFVSVCRRKARKTEKDRHYLADSATFQRQLQQTRSFCCLLIDLSGGKQKKILSKLKKSK